jgi:hypothetical protein
MDMTRHVVAVFMRIEIDDKESFFIKTAISFLWSGIVESFHLVMCDLIIRIAPKDIVRNSNLKLRFLGKNNLLLCKFIDSN